MHQLTAQVNHLLVHHFLVGALAAQEEAEKEGELCRHASQVEPEADPGQVPAFSVVGAVPGDESPEVEESDAERGEVEEAE